MRIVVWTPSKEQKPRICTEADAELARLRKVISSLHKIIPASGFHMLGLGPIDSQGSLIPPPPTQPLVQELMDEMENSVMRVKCYAALCPAARPWLDGFLKKYRKVRAKFVRLVTDVTYQMVTLLVGVGHDAKRNPVFYAKYKETIGMAARIVQHALPHSDAVENQPDFCSAFLKTRIEEYAILTPDRWLVCDSGSLSERALVGRFARLFEINLLRWDRAHGLRLPVVRRVLEFFAYELEARAS